MIVDRIDRKPAEELDVMAVSAATGCVATKRGRYIKLHYTVDEMPDNLLSRLYQAGYVIMEFI